VATCVPMRTYSATRGVSSPASSLHINDHGISILERVKHDAPKQENRQDDYLKRVEKARCPSKLSCEHEMAEEG
jgi:hypothetical protein